MARPEEKAQNMLNKWVRMREDEAKLSSNLTLSGRRPYLASLCENLQEAEKWRKQIIREISNGIRDIQNPGMGAHAIRSLNDKINKLLREKRHWNRRIKELGGPDHESIERASASREANGDNIIGLSGSGGYKYFGEAKNLPGVKELFMREAVKATKRKRGDIYKFINTDYYGLRDEEDGVLLDFEGEAERRISARINSLCERARQLRDERRIDRTAQVKAPEDGYDEDYDYLSSEDEGEGVGGVTGAIDAIASLPTQELVAETILDRKKK
eukprot:CAMPEP_0194308594 /NCGR_PEP_ID=MMETSP0171-20130528/5543_1 /TAXON_ID=218684 /ORGANISM="Corethron pennatum, Strain L29A3" /LENGTH=270 /DNA_ID=CAMNT_0039061301 /DNA_START=33 /DNA_END=842 /DNA_ORIENTATION=+